MVGKLAAMSPTPGCGTIPVMAVSARLPNFLAANHARGRDRRLRRGRAVGHTGASRGRLHGDLRHAPWHAPRTLLRVPPAQSALTASPRRRPTHQHCLALDVLVMGPSQVVNADMVRPSDGRGGGFVRVDVSNLADIVAVTAGADAIVHLAAIPSPGSFPDHEVFRLNMTASYNVLEAAEIHGIGRLAMASSVNALGADWGDKIAPEYFPIDEKHPTRCQDVYSATKHLGEQVPPPPPPAPRPRSSASCGFSAGRCAGAAGRLVRTAADGADLVAAVPLAAAAGGCGRGELAGGRGERRGGQGILGLDRPALS